MADRSSQPVGPSPLVVPSAERAAKEVENGYRQYDLLEKLIEDAVAAGFFRLRPSTLIDLNRAAVDGLLPHPGAYRQRAIVIKGSDHQPPPPEDVPGQIDLLCEYINDNWVKSPVHLASYVMWRLNWIHPFEDGNGRTSRAASYLVLCARLRARLPGDLTIPRQIADDKPPYYDALEAADGHWSEGQIDLSEMEALLERLLTVQIAGAASETWPTTRMSLPVVANGTDSLVANRVVSSRSIVARSKADRPMSTAVKAALIGGAFTIVAAILTIVLSKC